MGKQRIAVLVSGGGTNLQAIIDKTASGEIQNTEIVLVLSNNRHAFAIERAKRAGIPTAVLVPKRFPDRESFHEELIRTIDAAAPDLIVLAGCLLQIPPALIRRYENRIINIHPALIPSFSGKGCYGLHVHEMALARGVRVTGATVHYVDEVLDNGPIILQKAVGVRDDDTPETLQRRVMEEAEWELLPRAIDLIGAGRVKVVNGRVRILPEEQEC